MKHTFIFVLAGFWGLVIGQAHALELKDITFNTRDAGKVVFSHTKHLTKKSQRGEPAFNCATCHTGNKSKRQYTMADMYKGQSCGACHNGRQAFDAHQCSRCHQVKDVVFQVKETGPTVFSHAAHLKKLLDCSVCHTRLYKTGKNPSVTMKDMAKGKSCGYCHNGKKAFKVDQCSRCHRNPEISYTTPPVPKATFSHAFHVQIYSCKDCHPKVVKPDKKQNKRATMAEMGQGTSCGICHDGKTAFSVKGDCAKCHTGFKVPSMKTYKNAQGTVIGYFSHSIHTAAFQCADCHTKIYPYGNAQHVTMKQMENGASCGTCHNGSMVFSVKGDCLKCHKAS